MEFLRDMLEETKTKKQRKLTRRAKWDNWKKTQAMFYRKTGTNYRKWDIFESSESEEETEPIVPKDDPAFKVMEQDINDRTFRRRRDRKAANIMKDKGNDYMKRGLYKTANHEYTEALDKCRDFMAIYTNRALARIKLHMWQEAADDCTRVLEYQEAFNDGYEKMPDLCFKALTRRAQAMRGQKEF
jgi:tetratricopeptide (TPR) repeat protein